MIFVVFLYALLASTFTVAKITLSYAKPIFLIGFRMTLAGTLLCGYLAVTDRAALKIDRSDVWAFIKVTFFHVYLAFIAEFWALKDMSSSKVTLMYTLTPFIAALLSYFLLKERLTPIKMASMGLGFIGLLPIILLEQAPGESATTLLRISSQEAILLVAIVSASYAWFGIKKLMDKGYSFFLINGYAMFWGGIGALITSRIVEGSFTASMYNPAAFLRWVVLLVILANVIFYNCYAYLLKQYSITFLTFAGFLSPMFGGLFGWYFLGESITWHYFVSLACVTCALYLFYRQEITTPVREPHES